jgi:hypothetical protein
MHRSIRPALGLTLMELPLGADALEVALRDDVIVSLAAVKLAHLNALTFIYEMQADLAEEVLLATEGLEGR